VTCLQGLCSVVVTRLQEVYSQRRPGDDGGAKGGDGRDERDNSLLLIVLIFVFILD